MARRIHDTSRGLGRSGFKSMGYVDVCGMRNRNFPNSDPGTDRNYTYQQQPWDPQRPGRPTTSKGDEHYGRIR